MEEKKGSVLDKYTPIVLAGICGFTFWAAQSVITTMDRLTETTAAISQSMTDITRRVNDITAQVTSHTTNGIRPSDFNRLELEIRELDKRLDSLEKDPKK